MDIATPPSVVSATLALPTPAILVVEDSEATAALYVEYLRSANYRVRTASTLAAAQKLLAAEVFGAVVLDLNLPDGNGLDMLRDIRRQGLPTETMVVTATGTLAVAVEAMREGAFDFIVKPFARDRLLVTVRNALERLRLRAVVDTYESDFARNRYFGLVGASLAMQRVYRIVDSAAPSQAPIYISGESGTGKQLCAEAIHRRSARADGPFIAVSCSAQPRDVLERTLFGGEGAGPGAIARAHGGTLLLREVGDMDASIQARLLQFLASGTIGGSGGSAGESPDVRIVCSSTRDPRGDARLGRIREDLFFRLHVIPIQMPPVREREDDGVLLAHHTLLRFAQEEGKAFRDIAPDAAYAIRRYAWPGNVREIENAMRSVVVLHAGETVRVDMLPAHVAQAAPSGISDGLDMGASAPVQATGAADAKPSIRPLWIVEREIIEAAIADCDGNIPRAAAFLEISPSTIYRKKQAWEVIDRKS
ncbi:MAG: sigma-54-dependent Fis family transcriptional regulator [Telmatospirillum sp.]|nr:sigma-54-dependent Fis family transcriptional regulator [Telmatospirillum sp.]